jgi:membrane-bound metal-dependent hydrolase YbcI (DUF457 family)
MDIIHHTLIGGTGFIALSAVDQGLAGMAFIAASVFPDLDVFFMIFGKRFYLRNHQGPSHSLLLSPVYALFIISPALISLGFLWPVYLAALLGLWLHILLDLTNTFGIALFWPKSPIRRCFDAVFFIDTVIWFLTIAFYIQAYYFPSPAAIYIYAVLLASYLIFKYLLHAKVMNKLNCSYAIPGSFNPFTFFILSVDTKEARAYIYNSWNKKKWDKKTYSVVSQKHADMAEKSEVFRDMRRITKHFFITDVSESNNEITIIAHDIGVRNFGGRFGKTVLKFNINGDLVDEMAHI